MELHITATAKKKGILPRGIQISSLLRVLLLGLGPAATVLLCQAISLQSWGEAAVWIGGHFQAAALMWLLLTCGGAALWGLTRLSGLALLLIQLGPIGLTLVSYYKAVINGEPLRLSDLALAGNLRNVAGFAMDRITFSPVTISALAAAAGSRMVAVPRAIIVQSLKRM